jgi:DNA-binding MarR family transcriptional regulator
VHLTKLEDAGYIAVEKKFVDKKPRTLLRITEEGRTAFLSYVGNLKALLGAQLTRKK